MTNLTANDIVMLNKVKLIDPKDRVIASLEDKVAKLTKTVKLHQRVMRERSRIVNYTNELDKVHRAVKSLVRMIDRKYPELMER